MKPEKMKPWIRGTTVVAKLGLEGQTSSSILLNMPSG